MKLITLPYPPEVFLRRLRFATETDTVEKHQIGKKEAVFYSQIGENTFNLYERPAFVKEKTFYLGGVMLRGAVAARGTSSCQVATEIARFPENIRTALVCAILLVLSVAGTVLSGNLFATMLPLLAALSGGVLIADTVWMLIQIRRLMKKWEQILKAPPSDT